MRPPCCTKTGAGKTQLRHSDKSGTKQMKSSPTVTDTLQKLHAINDSHSELQ